MTNENKCTDENCPLHGSISRRGFKLEGIVLSDKMKRSAVVGINRVMKVQKFRRYEKRKTRISAHNPDCISAKKGDAVVIQECRPISKTKTFVIIKKMKGAQ